VENPSESPRSVRLAQFICELNFDDLPTAVVDRAKLCLLDQLGVQLVGATLPVGRVAREFVRDAGLRPESTIVGSSGQSTVPSAAFVD
jgi:2-methylcitrate dehydratase PrpD